MTGLVGAFVVALGTLVWTTPRSSDAWLALGPFLLAAGWPSRRPGPGPGPMLWLAVAAPVLGLAARVEATRAGWTLALGLTVLSGLALTAALRACALAAAREEPPAAARYGYLWLAVVLAPPILAWALDHGSASATAWPTWTRVSPLGWWAGRAPGAELATGSGLALELLGPWLGLGLLAAGSRGRR